MTIGDSLSFSNFFESSYIIHPFKETLKEDDHIKALSYSIFLGILTLGLVHLGCWITERCIYSLDKNEKKTTSIDLIGRNSIPKDYKDTDTDNSAALLYHTENTDVNNETPSSASSLSPPVPSKPVDLNLLKKDLIDRDSIQTPSSTPSFSLPVPSEPVDLNLLKKDSIYHVHLSLHPVITGYFGEPHQQNHLPAHLEEITLEDGSPLSLAPEDIAISFWTYNVSPELKKLSFPEGLGVFYLPAKLLEDKNEGDILRLKYKNHLVEFHIQQIPNTLRYTPQEFKPLLETVIDSVKADRDIETPLFSIPVPYEWYGLGKKGSLFHPVIIENKEEFNLEKQNKKNLRPCKAPKEIGTCNTYLLKNKKVIISVPFCSYLPEDIDIILNEKYLIFYGAYTNRSLCGFEEKKFNSETVFKIRWDRDPLFKCSTLEQMQERLHTGTMKLESGILSIKI